MALCGVVLPLQLALAYLRNRRLWPWPAVIIGAPVAAVGLLILAGAGLVVFGLLVALLMLSFAVTGGGTRERLSKLNLFQRLLPNIKITEGF